MIEIKDAPLYMSGYECGPGVSKVIFSLFKSDENVKKEEEASLSTANNYLIITDTYLSNSKGEHIQGNSTYITICIELLESFRQNYESNFQLNVQDLNLNQIEMLNEENTLLKQENESLKKEFSALKEKSDILNKVKLLLMKEKKKNDSIVKQNESLVNENKALKESFLTIKEKSVLQDKENESLKKELEKIKEKANSSEKINESLKKELKKIKEKVNSSEKINESLKKELAKINEKADLLEKEKESLKKVNVAIKEKAEILENENKSLNEEYAAIKEKADLLEKEEESLKKELSKTKEKADLLEKEKESLKKVNVAIKEKAEILENENKSLKKELAKAKEKACLLEKEEESLKKDLAQINGKAGLLEEEKESLKKELSATKEKADLLEEENKSLNEEHAAIKEKADSLIDENISLKNENNSIKEKNVCLIKEKKDSMIKYTKTCEENMSLKKENNFILGMSTQLNQKLTKEKKSTLILKKEKDKLNQDIANIEENNVNLLTQISEKNKEIERQKSHIEDQQKQIVNLSDEIITLKKSIQKQKIAKKQANTSCSICNNPVNKSDQIIFYDKTYHKNCIKCKACQKTFKLPEQFDEIVYINSKLFLCKDHYEEYQNSNNLPSEIKEEYKQEVKKNIVTFLFDNNQFFPEINNQPSEEIFITNELVKNSYQIHKPYELFVPTVELHFNKSPKEIDYDKLTQELIDNNLIIIDVRKGSTILKIAFMDLNECKENLNQFKSKILSPLGKSVVGNLLNEPEITIPDENKIKELYKKSSINILQHNIELNEVDIDDIEKSVSKNLSNEKKVNFKFLFSHQDIFEDYEEQLMKDIRNNAYEIIIVGETVFANRYINEYESIKAKIPRKNCVEKYIYHGSRLSNHEKIVKEHFSMPGKDKIEGKTDDGYYGKGIYGTDNLFYASLYGNGYKKLKINEKTSIIVCKAIYNKMKVKQIKDESYYGKQMDKDIANNYGINQALVGDKNDFWPIKEEEINDNSIVANEFVFPNKYQILPILSLMVMRTDHFILWKDEHISDENLRYFEQISIKTDVNFYYAKSYEEAIEIVNLKKRNKFKLITNSGENQNGKKLIEEIRKIVKSNFVCLVFTCSMNHIEWVTEMENVLFTNNDEHFREFDGLELRENNMLKFIKKLEEFLR